MTEESISIENDSKQLADPDCKTCSGHGEIYIEHPVRIGVPMQKLPCPDCVGKTKQQPPRDLIERLLDLVHDPRPRKDRELIREAVEEIRELRRVSSSITLKRELG